MAAATVAAAATATLAVLGASRGGKLSHHPSLGAVPGAFAGVFGPAFFFFPISVSFSTLLSRPRFSLSAFSAANMTH